LMWCTTIPIDFYSITPHKQHIHPQIKLYGQLL
jgi:hypothetical protein